MEPDRLGPGVGLGGDAALFGDLPLEKVELGDETADGGKGHSRLGSHEPQKPVVGGGHEAPEGGAGVGGDPETGGDPPSTVGGVDNILEELFEGKERHRGHRHRLSVAQAGEGEGAGHGTFPPNRAAPSVMRRLSGSGIQIPSMRTTPIRMSGGTTVRKRSR